MAAAASADWTGQSGRIAVRQAGAWLFVTPRPGMRAFDKGSGCVMRYDSDWIAATRPTTPTGGTVVDAEARQSIAQIVVALTNAGLVPPS